MRHAAFRRRSSWAVAAAGAIALLACACAGIVESDARAVNNGTRPVKVQLVSLEAVDGVARPSGVLLTGHSYLWDQPAERPMRILIGTVDPAEPPEFQLDTLQPDVGDPYAGLRLLEGYAYASLPTASEKSISAAYNRILQGKVMYDQDEFRQNLFIWWPLLFTHGISGGAEGTQVLFHARPDPTNGAKMIVRVVLVEGGRCKLTYRTPQQTMAQDMLQQTSRYHEFHVTFGPNGETFVDRVSDVMGEEVPDLSTHPDDPVAKLLQRASADFADAMAQHP